MPLIWDDNKYLLVDHEDDCDRNRCVVARKLFIALNKANAEKTNKQPFTLEFIDRNMRKFGAIDSIEILPNDKYEAYVTFASDKGAALALYHNEMEKKQEKAIFNMQPADTWKQPPQHGNDEDNDPMQDNPSDDENTPPILMLNEDCILEIAKYLDPDSLVNLSKVCKLFHRLLHQHCFPYIREYTMKIGLQSIPTSLAQVRRSLKCIGSHITQLTFEWYFSRDYDHQLQRYLDQLGKYVGENIRCVCFNNVRLYENHIPSIKNVLQHLDSLGIYSNAYKKDYVLDIDFTTLCPNVMNFEVHSLEMSKNWKSWPTLQQLSLGPVEFRTFQSFVQQNPQLRSLTLHTGDGDECLQTVAQNLPNIQKLTICSEFAEHFPTLTAASINHLSSLQHLTNLELLFSENAEISGILHCLNRFTGLRVVELRHEIGDWSDDNSHNVSIQQAMISLAQHLPNLEEFHTLFIKWSASTLIDFIQFAGQLKAIHAHYCRLHITNSLIGKIVKVLQSNRPQPQPTPLEIFVNPDDMIGLQTNNDQDARRFLKITAYEPLFNEP